jgi:hypothetical protein
MACGDKLAELMHRCKFAKDLCVPFDTVVDGRL